MPVYIHKNDQQSGPYEDHVVIEQLRNGMLSPDDFGFRHGGTAWQRLGEIFPDAVASTPPMPAPSVATPTPTPVVASAVGSAGDTSRKGGCRKILGWAMLVFGILLMVGGLGAAVVNRTIDPSICEDADQAAKELADAEREYHMANGTSREAEAAQKIKDKTSSLRIRTESCAEMETYYLWSFIVLMGVAAFGFFITILGFFIRRV